MKSTQLLNYADKPSEFLEAFWTLPNGKAPKLYDYQKEFLDYPYKEGPRRLEIVNKSRQTGFSTVCLTGRSFFEGYFHLRPSHMFVSASERQAVELLNHVKNAIDSLPQQLQPQLVKDKETEIRFKNGFNLISVPQSESSVRGFNGDMDLDEFAWLKKDKAIWTALMPSMRGGNRITVNSTPLGKRGEYYRLWNVDKKDGYLEKTPIEKQWKKFIIPWHRCLDLIPDIDMWRDNLTEDQFRQEFECEFVDESTAFFTLDLISSVVDEELANAKGYVGPNKIVLSADFAKKIDQSVFTATEYFDSGFRKVLAIEVLTKKPYEYQLRYLVDMFDSFKCSKLNFDLTGVGVALEEPLKKALGSKAEGINFTNSTKEKMIYNLKMLMEKGNIAIPDNKLLRAQLHGLQRNVTDAGNVQYKHDQNEHDDSVWSLAMGVYEESKKRNYGGSFFACEL